MSFGFTAFATNSFTKTGVLADNAGFIDYVSEAVLQFASPAKGEAFLQAVHTCLIDEKIWSSGVETAPVDGDQAVTANLRAPINYTGESIGTPLFVLHGSDVFALAASSDENLSQVTIPRAAQLIAELIMRVDALHPAPDGTATP